MGRNPLDVEKIVFDLILSDDMAIKKKLAKKILDIAYKKGIYPSSIHQFYMARGKGEFGGLDMLILNAGIFPGDILIDTALSAGHLQETLPEFVGLLLCHWRDNKISTFTQYLFTWITEYFFCGMIPASYLEVDIQGDDGQWRLRDDQCQSFFTGPQRFFGLPATQDID